MSQLDDFREQLRLAKGDDAVRQEAAASEPTHLPTPQKTVRKKKGQAQREPSIPDRTSISLSRRTFARLDCYNFWLRRNAGRNYPITVRCLTHYWTKFWKPMKRLPLL